VRDLDISSGGPTRSVPALAEYQSKVDGARVSIVFGSSGQQLDPVSNSRVRYTPVAGGFSQLPSFGGGESPQMLHLHGLWSPLLHNAARYAKRRNIPYVISPRGMMSKWALGHRALKKRLAWWLYQQQDLRHAAAVLPSSEFERGDVLNLLPDCTSHILPNGCELARKEANSKPKLPQIDGIRWAAAMGRLHPVKGYAELICAWAEVDPPAWKLAIAGPDEGAYRQTLQSLVNSKGLQDKVVFLGELSDAEKWQLFDDCELFLAPSKTENFGMVIAEALQAGTPVLTTTGTPWNELPELQCGWWVEPEVESLKTALREATSCSRSELTMMGARGRQLIAEKYTWESVAASSLEIYRSIIEKKVN